MKLLFYAAAGLGQRFWDELRDVALDACGEEIMMMTGLGATESSPYALSTGSDGALSGRIGLPVPGVEVKLVAGRDPSSRRGCAGRTSRRDSSASPN